MNIIVTDKNGKQLALGDIVEHGNVGAKYRVTNADENARGETLIQITPLTGQAWMWVRESEITLIKKYEKSQDQI